MIKFKTSSNDNQYIEIDCFSLLEIAVNNNYSDLIKEEAMKIYSSLVEYCKEKKIMKPRELEIRKDSSLGSFLLNGSFQKNVKNEDLYISYEDVINAFNIAVYEDNLFQKQLLSMFKNREFGSILKIIERYDSGVVDYIKNNNDYNAYLQKIDGKYIPKEYFVYENATINKITFSQPQKQKIK